MNIPPCKTTVLGSGNTIELCVNPRCTNHVSPIADLRIKRTPFPFIPLPSKDESITDLKKTLKYNYDMLDHCTKHYTMKIAEYEKKIAEIEK